MFGFIFIVAAVMSVISSKELLGNNNLQHDTIEGDKENQLESDLKNEVAALREMVLNQGQETSGLKLKQEQEISGLKQEISGMKQEIFLLNKKTKEQHMLIYSQDKLISELENVVEKQNEKIAELEVVTKQQSSKISFLKETVDTHWDRIKTLDMEENSPELFENGNTENGTALTNDTGTYDISSENINEPHFENKGHNAIPNIARKSRISASTNIAFSAYLDHNLNHLTSGYLIKCNQALLNVGNAYNTITGLFTVPKTGVYLLTFTINTNNRPSTIEAKTYVKLVSNNKNIIDAVINIPVNTSDQMGGNTAIVQLSAGESVWLEVFGTTLGQLDSDRSYRYVSFSGVLLF